MSKSPFLVKDFKIKSINEEDSEYYVVEGYASVYGNKDSYGDVVQQGAFAKDLLENGNEKPILWQHNSSRPIGLGTFDERTEGLFVSIKMPKSSDFVSKEVMPLIKCGAVKGLSIGYWAVKEEWSSEERINKLIELKLMENSICTFPANELAQITAAKQFLGIEKLNDITFKPYPLADEKTVWNEAEAIEQIKSNTGSKDKPSKNYDVGFMFCDSDKKEEFKSFQLPYVNYIGGEFKTVPEAIYQIAGTLAGDNINLTSELKGDLKNHINSVYKKLGQEEPFRGKSFFIDTATLNNIKKSDMGVIFNEHVTLSKNAKELIIKSLRSPGLDGTVTGGGNGLLSSLKELKLDMKTI